MARFILAGITTLFATLLFSAVSAHCDDTTVTFQSAPEDSTKRRLILEKILQRLPPDRKRNGPVSYHDTTFADWLHRTGELPPDFDKMLSIPSLPDPLVRQVNGKEVSVKTPGDWTKKRSELESLIKHFISGTFPSQPNNLRAEISSQQNDGKTAVREVLLRFGPGEQASLTIEMMIPPGKGPFPVFMTQWNHREWAQIALKRGYVACVLATADTKDDTEDYARIWAKTHDFTRLMRRAYGTFVAIDYLYTLPFIDKNKIGIAGHSRNGKLSLLAGALDQRISAVVTSSGGSGAEIPWRYTTPPYVVEDIGLLTSAQPAWFHPRLRFFIGNENKLPVDQNSYMALVAPRALMLSTSANESASNPWGAEQAFKSAQKVYQFLNTPDRLAIRYRNGFHGTAARDIEDYMDFFDYAFSRSTQRPENRLLYNYSFENWRTMSGENIDPLTFPKHNHEDFFRAGKSTNPPNWEDKKQEIRQQIQWVTGDAPPLATNPGPVSLSNSGVGEDSFGSFLPRPKPTSEMEVAHMTPYKGFGDYLYGDLYYPKHKMKNGEKLPVVIFLHPFDYSKGFSTTDHQYSLQLFFENLIKQGYAIFAFDMLGFGNRIDEGTRFYQRYPHWSKMGKMISDVRAATDALSNFEIIDKSKIYTVGYALGGTVGLLASAMDDRIAGSISVAGFTSLRTVNPNTEGVQAYSHLHGLLPRLGFFEGNENRIPFDFHEVLSAITPRPTLIIAPKDDWNAPPDLIEKTIAASKRLDEMYAKPKAVELRQPNIDNRFTKEMQETICHWLKNR